MNAFGKKKSQAKCSVVIVAAGESRRFGTDKTVLDLCGMPVLARTVKAFEVCGCVDEIVIVTREEKIEEIAELVREYAFSKVSRVVIGGNTRTESSLAGVSAVRRGAKLIAIHDAARPLVTADVIERTVEAAKKYNAAVPAVASTDTLRLSEDGFSAGTLDRDAIVRVQTPQVFDADLIKGALTFAVMNNIPVTDDSAAMEAIGFKTRLVEGDAENIKLTRPEDLIYAEAVLKSRGERI